MTREEAIKEYVIPALKHTWNEKINKEVLEALEQEPTIKNNTVDFNKINELADFAIKATGQRDSYSQGMCNGIEYLRAVLTDTEPKYFDSNDEYKESTTKSDLGVDCVLREQALKCFTICNTKADVWRGIKDLPSVTPQPKTGHWIEHEHNGIAHIECSECSSWFLRPHLIRNRYCPNCGAKMTEKEG